MTIWLSQPWMATTGLLMTVTLQAIPIWHMMQIMAIMMPYTTKQSYCKWYSTQREPPIFWMMKSFVSGVLTGITSKEFARENKVKTYSNKSASFFDQKIGGKEPWMESVF